MINKISKKVRHNHSMRSDKSENPPREVKSEKINTNIKKQHLVEANHKKIIAASLQLFLSKGYAQTTVRDIAQASNMSMGSLYNYVSSKDDVLFLVYNDMVDVIHASIQKKETNQDDPIINLKNSLSAVLEVLLNDVGAHALILFRESGSLKKQHLYPILAKEANFIKHFENILIKGVERKVFLIKDTNLIANMIVHTVALKILRKWNIGNVKDEELIKETINFVLNGILAPSSKTRCI